MRESAEKAATGAGAIAPPVTDQTLEAALDRARATQPQPPQQQQEQQGAGPQQVQAGRSVVGDANNSGSVSVQQPDGLPLLTQLQTAWQGHAKAAQEEQQASAGVTKAKAILGDLQVKLKGAKRKLQSLGNA